jgi:septal ring factor EnvC (AmiA/AmiB activator)
MLAALFVAASACSSCSHRTPDTVHTESETDREHRIEALLKDYERKIQELDEKVRTATGTLPEELERSLKDLNKKHQEAATQLEELRTTTNRSWKDVNAHLQISLAELKQSFDKVSEQLK